MFIIIIRSPPIIGFLCASSTPPGSYSYVYRFNQSKELHVIKTRTLHVPKDIISVVGTLREFAEENQKINCSEYANDTLLLISLKNWRQIFPNDCNLKAVIIEIDYEEKNRASSPLPTSTTVPFPTVLMNKNDEKKCLGKKIIESTESIESAEVSIFFNNEDENCLGHG